MNDDRHVLPPHRVADRDRECEARRPEVRRPVDHDRAAVVGDEHVPTQVAVDHLGRTLDRREGRAQPVDLLEGHVGRNRVGVFPRDPVPLGPGIGALVEESRPVQGRTSAGGTPRPPTGSAPAPTSSGRFGRGRSRGPPSRRTPTSRPETEVRAALGPRHRQARTSKTSQTHMCSTGLSTGLRTIWPSVQVRSWPPGKSAQRRPVGTECCDDVVGRDNHVDRLRAARQSESATQILTTVERYDR